MADNAAPMLTRDGAGRILRARWPPLVALIATLGYAALVIGFGLDFRPLHNDEGVTLGVASRPSAADVLRVAVDDRHGPPLHYLLVHASLVWRYDILGLRLPSAVLGIVAVAVIVCSGVAFAIAHATDSHPRVSSVQPPPRSVFLRAPYLLQ